MKNSVEIEVPSAKIVIRDDGVMHVHIKISTSFEIENSMEILEAREKLAAGNAYPILYTTEYRFVTPSKEVKDFVAKSRDRTANVLADAFVISSFSQRLAAKIYLKLNRPSVPTNFFSTEKEAIQWLIKYAK